MAKRQSGPTNEEGTKGFSEEELAVLRESSQLLRTLARQLRADEVSLDKAFFEDMRATIAYVHLPLLRRMP
jgi:hypothetical protein